MESYVRLDGGMMIAPQGRRDLRMVNTAVDFFDKIGQTEWHRNLQRTLVHWIGIGQQHTVLDIGCGAGHFVIQVAGRAESVIGVDASEEMVCRATLNLSDYHVDNATIVHARAQDLPFATESCDIVTCLHLLFMFPDPSSLLEEMLRVCKPGGQVILVDPSRNLNPWSVQTFCHENRLYDFERDSLLSLGKAAARYALPKERSVLEALRQLGIEPSEQTQVLDGLLSCWRIEKTYAPEEVIDDKMLRNV